MKSIALTCTAILLCVLLVAPCYSQEKSKEKSKSKAKWNSKVMMGGSFYSGNVNKLDLHSKGDIARNDSVVEYSAYYKVTYGKAKQLVKDSQGQEQSVWRENNNEYAAGVKFDYHPESVISPFVLAEVYKNERKNIEWRMSALGGVKWKFYSTPKCSYSVSAAGIYQSELYTSKAIDKVTKLQIPDKENFRVSIRPRIKQQIGESVYFEHTTFFKFSVNDFDDHTIESVTSISTKLNKHLSLELSYEMNFENKPAGDIKKDDHAFITAIVIKF